MQFSTLNIKAVSGPTSLVADALSDVKGHLKVTSSYEDDEISTYIGASLGYVERYCGITLGSTTWQLNLPEFPWNYRYIELPRGPVSSISSMYYHDTDNVSTLWAASDYQASLDELPARLWLLQDDTWEDTYKRPDAVQVQYVAGYASWAAVPDSIRMPIYYLAAHQHRYRQPVVEGSLRTVPWALRDSLQAIRENFPT